VEPGSAEFQLASNAINECWQNYLIFLRAIYMKICNETNSENVFFLEFSI